MTEPSPDAARLAAYANTRDSLVSGLWVTLATFGAMLLAGVWTINDHTHLAQFIDDPERLGMWMIMGALTCGVIAGVLIWAPLYLFILRKSEFENGRAALLLIGAGAFSALVVTVMVTLPLNHIVLAGMVHRASNDRDLHSFADAASAPALADPLATDMGRPEEIQRKASVLSGMIKERQAALAKRHGETPAKLQRLSSGHPRASKLAGTLSTDLAREDDLMARYWTVHLDYAERVGAAGAILTQRRSGWRLLDDKIAFRDPVAMAAYRSEMERLKVTNDRINRVLAEINATRSKP